MKIKINGRSWKIVQVQDNSKTLCAESGESVCGITHFTKTTIYINNSLNADLMRDTIIHELTHAYLFVYGFGQVENFTEENVCDLFGSFGMELMNTAYEIFEKFAI